MLGDFISFSKKTKSIKEINKVLSQQNLIRDHRRVFASTANLFEFSHLLMIPIVQNTKYWWLKNDIRFYDESLAGVSQLDGNGKP